MAEGGHNSRQEFLNMTEEGHNSRPEFLNMTEEGHNSRPEFLNMTEEGHNSRPEFLNMTEEGHNSRQEFLNMTEEGHNSRQQFLNMTEEGHNSRQGYQNVAEEGHNSRQGYQNVAEEGHNSRQEYPNEAGVVIYSREEIGDIYGKRIRELLGIESHLNIAMKSLEKADKRKMNRLECLLKETRNCFSTCNKIWNGGSCSKEEQDFDYDDDEIQDLKKRVKKEVSRSISKGSSATREFDNGPLDPGRHRNILKMQKVSVLVLAMTKFVNRPKKDRSNSDEYPSIRRFVDTFGYEDALERILENIIILYKMNFQNITTEHAERVGFKQLGQTKIQHMTKMQREYNHLFDKIANNTDLMAQISNETIFQDAKYQISWSKEEIELIMDIAVDNESQAEAIMVFVCSHGKTNENGQMEIVDTNWEPVEVRIIINKLSVNKNLPGMLFINACRGKKSHKKKSVVIYEVENRPQIRVDGHNSSRDQNPVVAGKIEERSETDERRTIIAQATEDGQHKVEQTEDINQRMRETSIGSGYTERRLPSADNHHENMAASLPQPAAFLNAPQSEPKQTPLLLESTGICPNNCLVLYTTTRGFMSDVDPQLGNIFISNFVMRLTELMEKCADGIAFIPFLQMLTGELAKEDWSGDLQMLAFDHSMCEMPVLISSQSISKSKSV